jgi:pyrimidine operon attenuation protein/uracil phosphoribosyltransferase
MSAESELLMIYNQRGLFSDNRFCKESIDTLYEKYRDMNSRLVLQDANQMIDITYDGERVAKLLQKKIKASKKVNLKKKELMHKSFLDEAKKCGVMKDTNLLKNI